MQEKRQMVPVWPRSPVWEPKRGPGAHCGASFPSRAPDTTCHCLTDAFQDRGLNLLHQLSHDMAFHP